MTKPDPNLVLVLHYGTDRAARHADITAVICYSNDGPIKRTLHEPGAILSPNWIGHDGLYQDYADLAVIGSLSGEFDTWLSWEVEYRNVYSIDADRAQAMAKTLKRIGKAMTTLRDTRGAPPGFNTYLARFAEVIGCKRYAQRADTMLPNGSHWRHFDVDGMHRWTTARETEFRDLCAGTS
jgi:hypothetical protein